MQTPFLGMTDEKMAAIRRFVHEGILPANIAERAKIIAIAQQLAEWHLKDLRAEGRKTN
jgi:hypothetical protein